MLGRGLLVGRERVMLVGGLWRRERTFGALAFGDDLAERLGIVAHIFDDTALDAHRLPEGSHLAIESLLGSRKPLIAVQQLLEICRKELPNCASSSSTRKSIPCACPISRDRKSTRLNSSH